MNHADPYREMMIAAESAEGAGCFWDRLPQLIDETSLGADRDRPLGTFQRDLRSRIAHRRSPETLQLFRLIARLTCARVEASSTRHFAQLFRRKERSGIVQGLFTELFDGGLAQFRGVDATELLDFLSLRADRAVLKAAVAMWALFEVRATHRARYRDLLSHNEVDELGADVLSELLSRSLARFKGHNDRQLYVYVRTAAHRAVSRAARRKILDRDSVAQLNTEAPTDSPPLQGRPTPPPRLRLRPSDPLPISPEDQAYIEALLQAGGKLSSLAEARGVTRGSVTKRVQRIMGRLDALEPEQRERVGEWAEATLGEMQASERRATPCPMETPAAPRPLPL